MLARYFSDLARLAPLVYLAAALPTLVFLVYLTPPFEAPDETNHFRREVQLLRGQIVGSKSSDTEAGGIIPKSVGDVAEALSPMIGHPEVKLDPSVLRGMRAIRWNRSDREFQSFVNTVIYPPFFYLPALGALALGQTLDLNVLDSYYLARLATGLAAVAMAALAIGMAQRGRALLLVLLCLPTTLYLFASVSQDALLVASVALAVGIASRAAGEGRPFDVVERIAVAMLIGAAVAARPPLFPLLGILLTRLVRSAPPRRPGLGGLAAGLAPFGLALAIAAAWILFGAGPAKVPFRTSDGVSIAGQIDYLLHHLAAVGDIASRTLSGSGLWHYKQFIGTVGWTDTYFPDAYYQVASVAVLVAAAMALFGRGRTLGPDEGVCLLIAFLMACVATYAALYLTWTPVGAASVDGAQGRYFLAGTMLLVPALPALAFWRRMPPPERRAASVPLAAGWLFVFVFAVVSDWSLPELVLSRFYL